jgi:beta-xylosidase
MKTYVSLLVASLAVAGCAFTETPSAVKSRAWCPDNGDGTFTNPIMWGDWPDPDVIRVDDTFYFISTSMHYVPGCPIAKSRDLVNWEMAGYAVPRYEEDTAWNRPGAMNLRGSWASTIRHHNGKFYVGFAAPGADPFTRSASESSHFSMCVADDIKGPWKRTIFKECMYDPGLLFDDDGKVYVIHGQARLFVTELTADALAVKTPAKEIFVGGFSGDGKLVDPKGIGPFGLEGSHAYKIGGKYYITNPGGGTQGFQICLRSDNIYGPYEVKRICKDDRSLPPNGLHQGGMVQLKNGDWWFIIMQDRGAIGRVPHLVPVKWVDGWPMLGKDGEGKGVITGKKPEVGAVYPITAPATTDEFDSTTLGLQWQWNHNPDDANWSLAERPGYLRLKAGKSGSLSNARNTLTQRLQGPQCEGTAELDVRGLKDGNYAGLSVFGVSGFAFIAVKQAGGQRSLDMVNNGRTVASIPNFTGDTVWFKSVASYSPSQAAFAYSTDGKTFTPLGDKMGMGVHGWTGNRFALFNYSISDAGVGGVADFNGFQFSMKPSK